MSLSQEVINGQRLLAQYRKRDGVQISTPIPALDNAWLSDLQPPVSLGAVAPSSQPQSFIDLFGETAVIHPALITFCTDYQQEVLLQSPVRLYLLMRHVDKDGRGCIERQRLGEIFTTDKYEARLYGSRRLRQILTQGEGVFWNQVKMPNGQIYVFYRKVAKVLHALGIEQVSGGIARVPVNGLLANGRSGQANANAHLYAGQLAARNNSDKPISRQKLKAATGFSPRRQRSSQKRLKGAVCAKRNIQIHHVADRETAVEQLAWEGKRPFLLTDYNGKLGRPFSEHVATMLPNSYTTNDCYTAVETNHKRRISKELKVLRNNGGVANGSDGDMQKFAKLFHDKAEDAGTYARKKAVHVAFYPATLKAGKPGKQQRSVRVGVWENAAF